MEKQGNSRARAFLTWYSQTSRLLGAPVLLVLVCLGIQRFVFTGTCMLAGWKCEYGISSGSDIADHMRSLLAANPESDIVIKPRSTSH